MATRRIYHGWIIVEREPGFKDHFSVEFRTKDGFMTKRSIGYGKAAEAVDFFETKRGLGPVRLESTPIGLRVFTDAVGPDSGGV